MLCCFGGGGGWGGAGTPHLQVQAVGRGSVTSGAPGTPVQSPGGRRGGGCPGYPPDVIQTNNIFENITSSGELRTDLIGKYLTKVELQLVDLVFAVAQYLCWYSNNKRYIILAAYDSCTILSHHIAWYIEGKYVCVEIVRSNCKQ